MGVRGGLKTAREAQGLADYTGILLVPQVVTDRAAIEEEVSLVGPGAVGQDQGVYRQGLLDYRNRTADGAGCFVPSTLEASLTVGAVNEAGLVAVAGDLRHGELVTD